jgi:hypothetical protein
MNNAFKIHNSSNDKYSSKFINKGSNKIHYRPNKKRRIRKQKSVEEYEPLPFWEGVLKGIEAVIGGIFL